MIRIFGSVPQRMKLQFSYKNKYFELGSGGQRMSNLKILVCGDVEGHFKTLFTKVGTLHQKKGPFEYLLCVGSFFGANEDEWRDVKTGKIAVPITTYILGPNRREHLRFYPVDSSEIAPNVIYLGKRGVLTGSSGLKIAYLSGVEQKESNEFSFSNKDVTELVARASSGAVDIFLTSQWPQGVTKYAKPPDNFDSTNSGSNLVAYLAKLLKPRYHFAGISRMYYERLPYRNHQVLQELPTHTTRFIGLASVDNEKKLKWLYAFNITPYCSMSTKELTNTVGPVTECPYGADECNSQFFYDMSSSSGHQKRTRGENDTHKSRKKLNTSVSQESCWFCLTNPEVQKQLLLSIGDHSYITLAKGGLVEDHLLIIPTEHVPASISLSDSADKEIEKYKNGLVNYFHDQEYDVIFFERNFISPHLQIQIVPVPKSRTSGITATIMEFAESHGLKFAELSKFSVLKQVAPSKKSYFYIEVVVNKKYSGKLLHVIEGNFPLQFGRMMLASKTILNVPDRVDWKECKMSPDEEIRAAENFRQRFKRYDFTRN